MVNLSQLISWSERALRQSMENIAGSIGEARLRKDRRDG